MAESTMSMIDPVIFKCQSRLEQEQEEQEQRSIIGTAECCSLCMRVRNSDAVERHVDGKEMPLLLQGGDQNVLLSWCEVVSETVPRML